MIYTALGIIPHSLTPLFFPCFFCCFPRHILSSDNNNNSNMCSSVCQVLQSCLEPRLVEPRVLIQNLAPPKSNSSQSNPWTQKPKNLSPQPQQDQNEMTVQNENDKNIPNQGKYCYDGLVDAAEHESKRDGDSVWSSIQTLTRTCQNRIQVSEAEQQVYVHPLVKRSSSALSTKSLEMCTENLGSETGSSIDQSIDDFPSPLLDSGRRNFRDMQRSRSREFTKKMDQSVGFPPPLTSISGVHMRTHREGGRLVLKAVSSCSSCFKAERANGRLRLFLMRGGYTGSDDFHDLADEYEENAYNMEHNEENEPEKETDDDEEKVETEDAAEDDANERARQWENGESVGYEIVGVGELARPSRCKEGGGTTRNRGMPSWRPFLVTIS